MTGGSKSSILKSERVGAEGSGQLSGAAWYLSGDPGGDGMGYRGKSGNKEGRKPAGRWTQTGFP